ncbi:MAG TPA: hypothetical protein VGH34_05725 [Vicinamibacterales bacterium]
MSEYSVGIEDHYAWANLVSVTTSGSDDVLLDRRRVALLGHNLAGSPYHGEGVHMPLSDAEKLVHEVTASANAHATSALSSLIAELAPATCRGIAIRVPPLSEWPQTVAEVEANTWIRNRADGMIYHHALTQAAAQLDLKVYHFEKDKILEAAAQARRRSVDDFERQLKALGTALGPPWRQGHVVACAAAILAHVSADARSSAGPSTEGAVPSRS